MGCVVKSCSASIDFRAFFNRVAVLAAMSESHIYFFGKRGLKATVADKVTRETERRRLKYGLSPCNSRRTSDWVPFSTIEAGPGLRNSRYDFQ